MSHEIIKNKAITLLCFINSIHVEEFGIPSGPLKCQCSWTMNTVFNGKGIYCLYEVNGRNTHFDFMPDMKKKKNLA